MTYDINEKDIQRIIKRLDKMQDSLNAIRDCLAKAQVKCCRNVLATKVNSVKDGISTVHAPLVSGSSLEKNNFKVK